MNKPFSTKMQAESYVDKVESVIEDIRDYLLSGIMDSLHDAEYETAAQDANVLSALMTVEVFVLSETPVFRQ